MPLITLTEDGPLGNAGDQVWLDDEPSRKAPAKKAVKKPAKKAAPRKKSAK